MVLALADQVRTGDHYRRQVVFAIEQSIPGSYQSWRAFIERGTYSSFELDLVFRNKRICEMSGNFIVQLSLILLAVCALAVVVFYALERRGHGQARRE